MPIHFDRTRDFLKQFDFRPLFIEELGWSQPSRKTPLEIEVKSARFTCRHVAQLAGAVVVEVEAEHGTIPDAKSRAAVHKEIAKLHHENLLIFVDRERTQSLWYWVKRQDGKIYPRDHLYFKGQPGDLFLGKLAQIVFDLGRIRRRGKRAASSRWRGGCKQRWTSKRSPRSSFASFKSSTSISSS